MQQGSVWLSLHKRNPVLRKNVFDPAYNWAKALSDERVWHAVTTTFIYTGIALAIELVLGLLIALLLDTDRKGYGLLRALMTLPLVVPPAVTAMMFLLMLDGSFGVLSRPAQWMVSLEAERTLRDLGVRGDIIKTIHGAFTARGQERALGDCVIDAGDGASPIIGRLVDKGLHDELTGEAYAEIDGTDGRAHRFRGVEAFEHAPPIGGIVEVRRFGASDDKRPTLVLAARSDIDLAAQGTAPGATWLGGVDWSFGRKGGLGL